MKIDLNGTWSLRIGKRAPIPAPVPGSVLSAALSAGLIPDPHLGDHEAEVRKILEEDCSFSRRFSLDEETLSRSNFLELNGIDTVCKVYLNGEFLCACLDMHHNTRVELKAGQLQKENEIRLDFTSPYRYIREYQDHGGYETFGFTEARSPLLRKANYMFGWDWGPDLADMGVFQGIAIESTNLGYLLHYRVDQTFAKSGAVKIRVTTNFRALGKGVLAISLLGLEGEGELGSFVQDIAPSNSFVFLFKDPKRWNPRGYGEQNLYELRLCFQGEGESQCYSYRLGIREIAIHDEQDEIGRNFAVYVNGKKIFLLGANYVPQDFILASVTPARTKRLLGLAAQEGHNCIRVWGGGYYPSDDFYDECDSLGLLVLQDLMFACASYEAEDETFVTEVVKETKQNLKRIRNHPCLCLISGDNENEDGIRGHGFKKAKDYLTLNEKVIAPLVHQLTDAYFLPSSPTSGEPRFAMPQDQDYLDCHFWPDFSAMPELMELYGGVKARLLDEFGFQSYPSYDAILRLMEGKEPSLYAPELLAHEKKPGAFEARLGYVERYFGKPSSFRRLVYLSQLLQAEVVQTTVESLRQKAHRCNGALYWQLNDVWPAPGWSAIDYDFGLKALHYESMRFCSPLLVSFRREGERLFANVSNIRDEDEEVTLRLSLITFQGEVLREEEVALSVEKGSSVDAVGWEDPFGGRKDCFAHALLQGARGERLSENFAYPAISKELSYPKAALRVRFPGERSVELSSPSFVRAVQLEVHDNDNPPSDNFFNLLPGERKRVFYAHPISREKLDILCLNEATLDWE